MGYQYREYKPASFFINQIENEDARHFLTNTFKYFNKGKNGVEAKGRSLNECIRLHIDFDKTYEGSFYWGFGISTGKRNVEWKPIETYLTENIHNRSILRKAISYHKKHIMKSDIIFAPDKETASFFAFDWDNTKEGYLYWGDFFYSDAYGAPKKMLYFSEQKTKIEIYEKYGEVALVINGIYYNSTTNKFHIFHPTTQHVLRNVIYINSKQDFNISY